MNLKEYPGVSRFYDNRGAIRYRYRRRAVAVYIHGVPGSEQFEEEYQAARDGKRARAGGVGLKAKAGSVNALVVAFYASPEWRNLKASSQASRRRILEKLREKHGDLPVAKMHADYVKRQMIAMAETPMQANRWLQLLRQLLDYAMEDGTIATNPAREPGVKKFKGGGEHTPWPEDEIENFEARWPTGTKERLAFDLFLCTGQRIGDVAKMMRTHIRDGEIRVVQEKTGAELWIPIHPQLGASLAAVPSKGLALLQRQSGQPYTKGGLDNWFRRKREAAGIAPGLSPHGLRKAAGRRLAEADATAHMIKAILGHKSLREVERYTRDADQRRNARAAMAKLTGTQTEPNLSSAADSVSSAEVKRFK